MKFFKHLKVVLKHKWWVFKLCCMAGIPWRGLIHDLSKFTPTELIESVKYFHGHRSPLAVCKETEGYSKAWLHHKGRNKHHFEYWIDPMAPEPYPVIPYIYTVEMICDTLSAGLVYQGKDWKPDYQLSYFKARKDRNYMNPKIVAILEEVYTEIAEKESIKLVINKKHLKEIYDKYTKN